MFLALTAKRFMRKNVRSVNALFVKDYDRFRPGNIVSVHPTKMRHEWYPSKAAIYVTEENMAMFKTAFPDVPLTIVEDEQLLGENLNHYTFVQDPFPKDIKETA